MNMQYEILRYGPEFKQQVVQLQTQLWSPDCALNRAYLEWKYERNPYMKTPFIHLAVSAGQVVGMRGMWGAQWQIGRPAQTFFAPCAGDLVIAADHRNRGLVAKIMEAAAADLADSGCGYVFNLSAGLVTQLSSLITGWRRVGLLETAQLGRERARAHGYTNPLRFVRRIAHNLAVPFVAKNRFCTQGHGDVDRYVSVQDAPRPDAMAKLIERVGSDGRLRHVRDQQYFAWRFQNPLSRYQFFFWADAALEGYLVLRTRVDGKRSSIVDWEATNMKVRADLLRAALHRGEFDKLDIWTTALRSEVKTLLYNAGFKTVKKTASIGRAHSASASRPAVFLKSVQRGMLPEADWVIANRRLLDLDNWDLRMIYADNY